LKSSLMLQGPPGTGKTTTLIKRLAQKTQLSDDNSEDILAINNKRFMNNINHKDSWLMFTQMIIQKIFWQLITNDL